MNIYKSLNEIINYIEDHLEEKIDYKKLAKMIGVNVYTLQRIFTLLNNITLTEYIRKRRLSNAGYDLCNLNMKVIDIAIKYQYESATAFSRAFRSFHGIKPSEVKKYKNKLKNYPIIVYNENVVETPTFEYNIIEKEKMVLYGISVEVNNQNVDKKAPKLCQDAQKLYAKKYGIYDYGMVTYDENRDGCQKYYVLYDKKIEEFEKVIIPKSKWLVFKLDSRDAKKIQELSQDVYLRFLPSSKYNLSDLPDLEYYHDNVTEYMFPLE